MKYEAVELRNTRDFNTINLHMHGVGIEELTKISRDYGAEIKTLKKTKSRYLVIKIADVNLTFWE